MNKTLRNVVFAVVLTCVAAFAFAQAQPGHEAAPSQSSAAQSSEATSHDQTTHPQSVDGALSEASQEAVSGKHEPIGEEEEENANLKYSGSVKWIASKTGLSPHAAYWVFIGINFAVLASFLGLMLKSSIPGMMRDRNASIKKGIEEARKASAEATSRLNDIDARLAKLDTEISQLRQQAEADFSAEEARIKQSAEDDARRVVESAEQEISAAGRAAQRELKAYAAELAVSAAEKKIKVDAATDQALVRGFVEQFGKDGR